MPPLAAMISALRRSVRLTASRETCGSASHSAWRRANPSGSRVRARLRVSEPLPAAPATRQPSEGRTRSPQIATTRAPDSSSRSHRDSRPRACCQAIGSARQLPPAASAPLAIQPVQEPGHGAYASFLAAGVGQDEYPAGEPCPGFAALLPGGRPVRGRRARREPVSYTHLRAHETRHDLVCRLLLEKKKAIRKTEAHP